MKTKTIKKAVAPKAKAASKLSNPTVDMSKMGQSKLSIQPQEAQELMDRRKLRESR